MNLSASIETILFYTGGPVKLAACAKLLSVEKSLVRQAINALADVYEKEHRGIRIISNDESAEMATAPEGAALVNTLSKLEETRVSDAKIETLTILAYLGPVTKDELEHIRGVNCSLILKNLTVDDWIEETVEQKKIYYMISTKCMRHLGIRTVAELPSYKEFNNKDAFMAIS